MIIEEFNYTYDYFMYHTCNTVHFHVQKRAVTWKIYNSLAEDGELKFQYALLARQNIQFDILTCRSII